jgi:VWFA-related protein
MKRRLPAIALVLAFGLMPVDVSRPAIRATASDVQAPSSIFRVGVDLIPVDVHVLDRGGRPVEGLTADKFEVTIGGRRRRVVSADLIDLRGAVAVTPAGPAVSSSSTPGPVSGAVVSGPGRIVILAVDCASFDESTVRPVLAAAVEYIRQLRPEDEVGLFAYPIGPKVDPTTDHDSVIRALDTVIARREAPPAGRFNLSVGDLVELSRIPHTEPGRQLVERFCGRPPDQDDQCVLELEQEVSSQALFYEGIAHSSIATLQALMAGLGAVPERKTLVLISGGIVSADIPGARPDNRLLGIEAGRSAARSNVSVHTLFLDQRWMTQMSAESRRPPSTVNPARDSALVGQWLDEFSGAAGGSLIRVTAGNGQTAFTRILGETSAYYLLGVEPIAADRDGRPHELRVRVNDRGVTVRGRSWVVIPRPGSEPVVARVPTPVPAGPSAPAARALPAPSPAVRALAAALDRDDREAFAVALAARDADTLIQNFRESESPWPGNARRTALFALELALSGLGSDSSFTRSAAASLLAEYAIRVRQPVEGDVFECAWFWAATAGLQGHFNLDAGVMVAERGIARCPADANLRLALAVVRDQQLTVGAVSPLGAGSGPGAITGSEQRVLDLYGAASASPDARYEATIRSAVVHLRAGRYADGMRVVDGAGAPPNDMHLRHLGLLIRGHLLRLVGRHDEAIAALRAALDVWPGAQTARVALMSAVAMQGASDEASDLANRLVTAPGGDSDPWWTYYLGDYRVYPHIRARLRELAR